MKIKTSVTLSEDVLRSVDEFLPANKSNRSEFIETALVRFINYLRKEKRDEDDLKIINRRSKRLNEEAADVLTYQVQL